MTRRRIGPTVALSILLLAVAVLPRVAFLGDWASNFDGDEALVALQGLHLLDGTFALYLPGQSYMGSLQSLVVAPLLGGFGAHPIAARLAPMLWLLPGLLALLALERLGSGVLGRGRGAWILSLLWLCPPAVLFLAGVKIRGGNLEVLVLGFWMLVLLWPRAGGDTPARPLLRWTAAGLLLGLGLWTHDQMLLFAPLVPVCLALESGRRTLRALGFAAGFVVGHLPLWLPRLAPMALGPPGTEGSEWALDLSGLVDASLLGRSVQALVASLTTGAPATGAAGFAQGIYVVAMLACLVAAPVLVWARPLRLRDRSFWRESPAFTISLWLAAATVGALLFSPEYFEDPQWFRYTLGITPLFVVSAAHTLARLPSPWPVPAAVLVALLALNVYRDAISAWEFPFQRERLALVQTLEARGITRVATTWDLAYVIRFLSEDRILTSSKTPPRYPAVNAQVAFSPQAWVVRSNEAEATEASDAVPVDRAFQISQRRFTPSDALRDAFAGLDPSTTLFAHYEPYPLLPDGSFPTDWRGWPYRRPLDRFDAIVWQPKQVSNPDLDWQRVDAALRELEASGAFTLEAAGRGQRILRRAKRGDR